MTARQLLEKKMALAMQSEMNDSQGIINGGAEMHDRSKSSELIGPHNSSQRKNIQRNHQGSWDLLAGFASKFIWGEIARRLRVVNIEVTFRCNAQCAFCSHWQSKCDTELPSYVPVLERFKPMVVNLTGGEPLLRQDLPEIISTIKTSGHYYVSLLTNGWLLTEEKARVLRESGLDGISLSLNYLSEEHDKERHINGLFQHLTHLIPRLPRLGFRRVDINTVILESNLDELIPLAEQAGKWGVGLSLSCYSAMKAGSNEYDVRQVSRLLQVICDLRQKKAAGWPITSSDWFLKQIPRFYTEGGIPNCLAGRKAIHVTPDGFVKPCPDLPVVAHYSHFNPRTFRLLDCKQCWYRCRGELESPLTLRQIMFFAKHVWKSNHMANFSI